MFESRLAPAPGAALHRDLSSFEIWDLSLARSRRRRELAERHRKAAPKTKGTAAAMSAALLVSPALPVASAGAQSDGSGPAAAPPNPSPDLGGVIVKRGDVGGTVAEVQRQVGVDDDGIFGAITELAVGDFQSRSGLQRTGVVDLATWKALFRASVSFVRADSVAAKRIVAQLPLRPQAPKRQSAVGGGQPTADGGSRPASDAGSKLPAPRAGEPAGAPPRPARAPSERAPGSAAAPAPAPAGSAACGDKIITPVRGTVTSGFGDGRNHAGVDIAAPVGTAVRAAACGTVSSAGSQGAYGNIICIQHSSSFSSCYAHLSEMSVRQGTYVNVGQVIGRVGMTGRTTGPHLHFETRVGGRAQDPTPYLSGARPVPGKPQAGTARAVTTPKVKQAGPPPAASGAAAASQAPSAQQDARAAAAPAAPVAQPPAPQPPAPAPTSQPPAPAPAAPAPAVQQQAPAPPVQQQAPASPVQQQRAPEPVRASVPATTPEATAAPQASSTATAAPAPQPAESAPATQPPPVADTAQAPQPATAVATPAQGAPDPAPRPEAPAPAPAPAEKPVPAASGAPG